MPVNIVSVSTTLSFCWFSDQSTFLQERLC